MRYLVAVLVAGQYGVYRVEVSIMSAFDEKYAMPRFMKHAKRFAYAHPDQVGWAAWWEFLGTTVAFERLDGTMVYDWDDTEADPCLL